MSAWSNLAAISVSAASRDRGLLVTKPQVGAVAGWLNKQIQRTLANRLGLSVDKGLLRSLRLQLLNDVLPARNEDEFITSTKQISFAEASAILDWLNSSSAAEDMAAWLMEQDLPYAEEMF
jgi:hypothetical protein